MIQQKPLVFFDLEATGTNAMLDRIVDIALVKRLPDGTETSFSSLVNPGGPIPKESSDIHHITDDMVRSAPSFRELVPSVLEFIAGCDLGGYNVLKYDIPLLQAEFKRAGHELPLEGRAIVDAFVIFSRMEPRTLSAAYKLYCNKPLPDAHRAEPDARAALEVLLGQVERYADLPKDVAGLAAFCNARDPKNVDAQGKFVWRNGEAAFNFGKHRSLTLKEICSKDPSYVRWLMGAEQTTPELAKICENALAGKFPVPATATNA